MIDIFCSYSHVDEPLWRELEKHLEGLRRQGLIRVWSDRKIGAGSEWAGAIDSNLDSAQVVLLLISADFLASDYCMNIEVTRAISRHARGEAVIVPVVLRPVDWEGHPLKRFQALPSHGRPITEALNRDEAFREVVVGLRRIISESPSSRKGERIAEQRTEPNGDAAAVSILGRFAEATTPTDKSSRQRTWRQRFGSFLLALGLISIGPIIYVGWQRAAKPLPRLIVPAVRINQVDGLPYVRIPQGNFLRGCDPKAPGCPADAQPQHLLTISYMYWIGQTEVTLRAYKRFSQLTGHPLPPATPFAEYPDYPVVNVSWSDASDYCSWAGGRLPFEVEWAYVAEGRQMGEYQIGWFLNESGSSSHRVATLPPNNWLLYDLLGNVWEWCLDWYDPTYYQHSELVDPLGPAKGNQRVMRGGSWKQPAEAIFVYTRSSLPPETRASDVGFRCVVETLN